MRSHRPWTERFDGTGGKTVTVAGAGTRSADRPRPPLVPNQIALRTELCARDGWTSRNRLFDVTGLAHGAFAENDHALTRIIGAINSRYGDWYWYDSEEDEPAAGGRMYRLRQDRRDQVCRDLHPA